MNRRCIYLVEGECEEKLINALKEKPSLLIPGKIKKFNVIQDELKTSHLVTYPPGCMVVLVFDTVRFLILKMRLYEVQMSIKHLNLLKVRVSVNSKRQ